MPFCAVWELFELITYSLKCNAKKWNRLEKRCKIRYELRSRNNVGKENNNGTEIRVFLPIS